MSCLLVAAVVIVYAPLRHAGFIDFDDHVYVRDFDRVHRGLTADNVRWAFTTGYFANWHPLTWLSYMADCQLFGVSPAAMHVENIALHAINTILLLLVLNASTARLWPSAAVAVLFALHPMHVESVAWISERKDVLSMLFLLIAQWAYIAYARRPNVLRYFVVAVAYVLSLMSKSMGVSFPVLLLLWDVWPLERGVAPADDPAKRRRNWRWLVLEKCPLAAMALLASVVAWRAQQTAGALSKLETLPLARRLPNVAVAYVVYLGKLLVPIRLAVFYPFPRMIPAAAVVASLALLLLISALAWRLRRRRPVLIVGWLWFVISLLPVIGIVQVGSQSMADRYSYLPSIGLFVAIVWLIADLPATQRWLKFAATATGCLAIVAYAIAARIQVGYWQDSMQLFRHAMDVTEENWLAHYQLGLAYAERGDYAAAAGEFQRTIELHPTDVKAYNNLGNCVYMVNPAQALPYYQKAAELDPNDLSSHYNLGNALLVTGRFNEAAAQYRRALEIDPTSAAARDGLAHATAGGAANH